ncbi:MAG: DUF2264 domain-containing protein [Chitinivibrionales bacterium]|nr:DUF2264 domain-containing protein [Chitinivibrionales bacterium]
MKRFGFQTPYDHATSSITGFTRRHWEEAFYILMLGIVDSASPGGARQRIAGQRSHHGQLADELEGFSRSFIMAGPWLHTNPNGTFEYRGRTVDVAAFYRRGLLAGTDSAHPEYWGDIADKSQHLVECAALAWSLFLSRRQIWDTFSAAEKQQVAGYLYQCTAAAYFQNNWLLFNVITNVVLKRLGMPFREDQVESNIRACDDMYMGGGWYRDGQVNRIDYYNAWAFHYYYLLWVILDGASDPSLACVHKTRVAEFARSLQYFFAGDGSAPCFGRSMIYRFSYLSPLVLGQYLGCLDLAPGLVKTICNAGMKFYLEQPILTDANHLSLGFLAPCDSVLENYNCGGSPYWACKAFNAFLIPEGDPFWTAPELPLPVHERDYCVAIEQAGLQLIGHKRSGHVQLVNHKARCNMKGYEAKYTNFAYSSVFTYESRRVYDSWNCDNALSFSADGVVFRQRWTMDTLYCVDGFSGSRYELFEADENGQVFSSTLVKDDFLVNVHLVEPSRELVLREGGYALGFDSGEPLLRTGAGASMASIDGRLSYIRALHGYPVVHPAQAFHDQLSGTNARYRRSVVPSLELPAAGPGKHLLVSVVCGRVGHDSFEELQDLVRDCTVDGTTVQIEFYDGEQAVVQGGVVEDKQLLLNGTRLTGALAMARVSPDGSSWQTVRADGREERG